MKKTEPQSIHQDASCKSATTASARAGLIYWPDRILGPPPGLTEINVVCWGLFIACFLLPLFFSVKSHLKTGPIGDFVYFYGDGRLANEYAATRLYDYALQLKVFDEIDPTRGSLYGPSPYPPFVALFFGLFARLPARVAYMLWFVTSLAFYTIGVGVIVREIFPVNRLRRSLIFCFALAFPPFLFNTLVSGQLSSVAVCSIGVGIVNDRRARPFQSGLALSLLAYKPTLLVVILPMLLLSRKFKLLSGLLTGASILCLFTTVVDGAQIWRSYLRFLRFFERVSNTSGILKRWMFVDLYSFSYPFVHWLPKWTNVILLCVVISMALWLATLWRKAANGSRPSQTLAWANALTWTLLLNAYVPIYDSILVVIAIVLTFGALIELGLMIQTVWTILLSMVIFVVSWKTVAIAEKHGIQLLTILLLFLGIWQLLLLHYTTRLALCTKLDGYPSNP